MSKKLYTKRNALSPDVLTYELPEHVRTRILATFEHAERAASPHVDTFSKMLKEIGQRCEMEYGLKPRSYIYPDPKGDDVKEHFYGFDVDRALDFIEMCFQMTSFRRPPALVDQVNEILREEGIGYEFSPYVIDPKFMGTYVRCVAYPEATKKSNDLVHQTVVMPCLQLLTNPKFKTANEEMLKAHEHYRKGHYDDANTACGRAFESVFKTICDDKKWTYDKDKHTLSHLVEICRDKALFPPFYAEIFKASGTVRNKLGGHGKGPTPQYTIGPENVDHMIQMTSAHILLLAKLAGI